MSGSVVRGDAASRCDVTRCGSQPLKPAAKKYRSDGDGDRQTARCKRKLDFVGDDVDGGTAERGRRLSHGRGGGGSARRAASVARRNERERKRVSLINRTFETLRDQLPASLWGHRNLAKVSKVETLRAAIGYIRTLEDLLAADDADVEEESDLVEMLSSAERLASLAGDDRCLDAARVNSSPPRYALHAAASACERLEHLTSGTPPPSYVDIHGATRRLARLTAAPAVQPPDITQRPFYGVSDCAGPCSQEARHDDDGEDALMLDINSNYDNVRHLTSLKPDDDDVSMRQFVGDNFVFDNCNFSPTVGS